MTVILVDKFSHRSDVTGGNASRGSAYIHLQMDISECIDVVVAITSQSHVRVGLPLSSSLLLEYSLIPEVL